MNGENIKFSIVLAAYNGEKYITEQLESLKAQTMKPYEVIILDDCSTDATVSRVKGFISDNDLEGWRVEANEVNCGWRENFRRGFEMAAGDYIFPCDQDDIWHADKCETMIKCMLDHPELELLASDYNVFFDGKDNGSGVYKARAKAMVASGELEIPGMDPLWPYINRPGCTYCFKKAFFNSIKSEWNAAYPHDAILWRYARMDNAFGLLKLPLIEFRRHGDNASSSIKRTRSSRIKIFEEYIFFHNVALGRVTDKESIKILNEGVDFLKLRIKFFKSGNPLLWLRLAIKYRRYYLTFKGCLGDLYFVYVKR